MKRSSTSISIISIPLKTTFFPASFRSPASQLEFLQTHAALRKLMQVVSFPLSCHLQPPTVPGPHSAVLLSGCLTALGPESLERPQNARWFVTVGGSRPLFSPGKSRLSSLVRCFDVDFAAQVSENPPKSRSKLPRKAFPSRPVQTPYLPPNFKEHAGHNQKKMAIIPKSAQKRSHVKPYCHATCPTKRSHRKKI